MIAVSASAWVAVVVVARKLYEKLRGKAGSTLTICNLAIYVLA